MVIEYIVPFPEFKEIYFYDTFIVFCFATKGMDMHNGALVKPKMKCTLSLRECFH